MITKAAPSPTRAPDPRPARTRAAILAAIENLGRQGRELSVSQVVAEAGLSRSSFYSQFNDIGDVAVQLIREFYEQHPPSEAESSSHEALVEAAKRLLAEFDSRRFLYSAVLGSSAVVSAEWETCEIIAEAWQPIVQTLVPDHVDPEFAARYLASGHVACVVAWLRSETPVELADVEAQLVDLLPSWAR